MSVGEMDRGDIRRGIVSSPTNTKSTVEYTIESTTTYSTSKEIS
ncbi:11948_t:CDS:2 [Ambispora gerdemannii]|uniref:11948_t:CDS:1 n=1 Tax=Ambispora gerdemannii TaxID=144530 RepID=A0A9N8ZW76_9GLOM|nr:11948_t:CDS:2 [Ambispora gerdemannii]